jgi:hypothetical protein
VLLVLNGFVNVIDRANVFFRHRLSIHIVGRSNILVLPAL